MTRVVVTDPFADPNSVSFVGGDTNTDGKLDLSETWTYSAKHTVTQGEIDAGANLVNTANESDSQGENSRSSATTLVDQDHSLAIAKVASTTPSDSTDTNQADHAGQVINYMINVTNTGNETLTVVVMTDPTADTNTLTLHDALPISDGKLDLSETWTYSAKHTVTQGEIDAGANLVNTA